jgi:hypothetical protein
VIGRTHHLSEERLFDGYVAERSGEPLDPPAAEHLADCGDCRDRFADLRRFMDGLRSEADADVGALFPPEWQAAQRHQIDRRLEHVGHAARVISFPAESMARHIAGTGARFTLRWAVAAAVAGLLVGVAVGMYYDSPSGAPAMTISRSASVAAPAVAVSAPPPALDPDAFLTELEMALGGPRTPELRPFDELTPHVREIMVNSR